MMRSKPSFELSVDTRSKGRKLDAYTVRRIDGAACPIQLI
jgi:hypothetical protein